MQQLKRILCADDEPDMRMLIKLALENTGGYEVDVCVSGQQLLERLNIWKPDLILLDFRMPGMNGMEVFLELQSREDCRSIPVVFMTGTTAKTDIDMMKASGVRGVIVKPFDPLALSDNIVRIWDEKP